jgi:hypothetical protein
MWSRSLLRSRIVRRMMIRRRVQGRGRPTTIGQLQVSSILILFIFIFV